MVCRQRARRVVVWGAPKLKLSYPYPCVRAAQDGGAAGCSAAGAAPSPSGSLANCKELTFEGNPCYAEATGVTARQASEPPINRCEQSARESSHSEKNALCTLAAPSNFLEEETAGWGRRGVPGRQSMPRRKVAEKRHLGIVGTFWGLFGDFFAVRKSLRAPVRLRTAPVRR